MYNQIKEKVRAHQRITDKEALWLLTSADLLMIGELATMRRKAAVGDHAFYQYNFNINHTNICENKCSLCAFYKEKHDGYVLSLDEIENAVRTVHAEGVDEVHIVGGLNKELPFHYFIEMMQRIKRVGPIFIQAFTAVEIDFFARLEGISSREVLIRLHEAGLDTLPGGGAEVFAQEIRSQIAEKKISGERWLEIHEEAHQVGVSSNATMLYGHIERPGDIVDHLRQVRQLQDRTKGFYAFVPLAFFPEHTAFSHTVKGTNGIYDMKVMGVSRIYLDSIPHLKALWMIYGYKGCQVGLDFGADDIGGTYYDELIVHAAGAKTPRSVTEKEICTLIERMGRVPIHVNSRYEVREKIEKCKL